MTSFKHFVIRMFYFCFRSSPAGDRSQVASPHPKVQSVQARQSFVYVQARRVCVTELSERIVRNFKVHLVSVIHELMRQLAYWLGVKTLHFIVNYLHLKVEFPNRFLRILIRVLVSTEKTFRHNFEGNL